MELAKLLLDINKKNMNNKQPNLLDLFVLHRETPGCTLTVA